MNLSKKVVQHIKRIVLVEKAQGHHINYRSIVNRIESKFSIELTEDEIFIVQDFKHDLVKAIDPWAPALHEIRSAVANVKIPSEPRE